MFATRLVQNRVLVEDGKPRSGNNGIRHLGGRSGGHCHFGYHANRSEGAESVGRHSDGHKRSVTDDLADWPDPLLRRGSFSVLRRKTFGYLRSEAGQSTVEYAVVLFAVLGMLVGLGVLGNFLQDGGLVQHALQSASHHLTAVSKGALLDVFLY